jgi:hypothetical protein
MDDEAKTMSYGPQESDKRYEAVMYTINGVDKMAYFDDSTRAHGWIMKRCEDYTRANIEYAAVIYDQHENRKRLFVMDRWFLLAGKDYH